MAGVGGTAAACLASTDQIHSRFAGETDSAGHTRTQQTDAEQLVGSKVVNRCSQGEAWGRTGRPGWWYGGGGLANGYIYAAGHPAGRLVSRDSGVGSGHCAQVTVVAPCVHYDNGATSAGGLGPDPESEKRTKGPVLDKARQNRGATARDCGGCGWRIGPG